MNNKKSTVEDIRNKFDSLVDKFSSLETGQDTIIDSVLILDLLTKTVTALHSDATELLDIGCGAGNYSVKIASFMPAINCTLIDLSSKMLERAVERAKKVTSGKVIPIQGDIRKIELREGFFDIIVAGTSLHHLRSDEEWKQVVQKIYNSLKPGGSFWISDIIVHENEKVNEVMWNRYAEILISKRGEEVKNWVFEQIEIEDTPRTLNFQVDILRNAGFKKVEILHKHATYAAFGGIKRGT